MTAEDTASTHTAFTLRYPDASQVLQQAESTQLALFGNLHRPEVSLNATLKEPLSFRAALAALYAVVSSDFRYTPKDRTAYLAYQRLKRDASNLNLWEAQQAYFDWLLRNDPLAFLILDPIITVHPDSVILEVFSKDEGSYASLALAPTGLSFEETPRYGTTNIDFSENLLAGIQRIRSYHTTHLAVGSETVSLSNPDATGQTETVIEKTINVPDTWLRGFLQVQAAATLPHDTFTLAPIDLYNVLRHLRLHADKKGQRRGLRIELVPGEPTRLILEPWEILLTVTTTPYQGKNAQVLRVWGRRRLMLLQHLLAFTRHIEVHVLGTGLPSFWVLRGEHFSFTLGLTGFTAANWGQAVSFDVLLPRTVHQTQDVTQVISHLQTVWCDSLSGISQATGLQGAKLLEALQLGCQQGQLMYELASDLYRLRPVSNAPLDLDRLEYRNPQERSAHDLVARGDAVTISLENRIHGSGLELTGSVKVAEDKREYRPQLLISEAGYINRAQCTCNFFRKQGLKQGPCAHLLALRLYHAQREARRQAEGLPQGLMVETRTFSKRRATIEAIYQLTLNQKRLRIQWGNTGQPLRVQTLHFNSADNARAAYLTRVQDLKQRGYIDATLDN